MKALVGAGAVILLATAAFTACAAPPVPEPSPESSPEPSPTVTASESAEELIGVYEVRDAVGEPAGSWVRVYADQFVILRECGLLQGSWRGIEGMFTGVMTGFSMSCLSNDEAPTVPWLDASTGYQRSATGWQLIDSAGTPVVTLEAGGAPDPAIADQSGFNLDLSGDFDPAIFERPVTLPDGLTAPTESDLERRWIPAGPRFATNPYLEFESERRWTASDGCNGSSGRYILGAGGLLAATSSASTLVACEGAPTGFWMYQAALAGLDGEELVLLDRAGAEVARLVRSSR
jgi:hypothetical protein